MITEVQAVLHIDWISNPLEAFANSHEHRVLRTFPNAVYYALDAHSNDLTWHFAQQLLQHAEGVYVVVELGNAEVAPQQWKQLVSKLLKFRNKMEGFAIIGRKQVQLESLQALGLPVQQFSDIAQWLAQ